MKYTNSKLVSYTKLTSNHSGKRVHNIERITPHCVVGQCSVETLGDIFYSVSKQASCQYGIGEDGRIGMYVEEKNCSWCSSSNANDQRAITIECASDTTHPYAFKDVVYQTLITLCVDICKRNGKKKLLWLGGKGSTAADKAACENYSPKSDEMILTAHRFYANKSCPGDWMYSRLGDLATKVTTQLGGNTSGGSSSGGTTPSNNNIKAGSVVKIASNATYYGGQAIPSWVKAKNWIVNSVSGDRAVIDKSQDGQNSIMSPINVKYLTLVSGGSTGGSTGGNTTPTTPSATVKVGAVVKIASNATYYGGQAMPDWVKAKAWIVHSMSGDRVVIDKSQDGKNSIMSPVNIKYLTAVSGGSNSGSTTTFTPYKVKVTTDVLNIRKGAGTNYATVGQIKDHGVYTITKESSGTGATKWGFLKSGAGWISLDFVKKV